MSFDECIKKHSDILMEGALGERLKREYGLKIDKTVAGRLRSYTDPAFKRKKEENKNAGNGI